MNNSHGGIPTEQATTATLNDTQVHQLLLLVVTTITERINRATFIWWENCHSNYLEKLHTKYFANGVQSAASTD